MTVFLSAVLASAGKKQETVPGGQMSVCASIILVNAAAVEDTRLKVTTTAVSL